MALKESVLERVIRKIPNIENPSPFPIEENIFLQGPWAEIGKNAVMILKNPEEIRDFMARYADHISQRFGVQRRDAESNAREVVGYSTGYVDDEQANRWFNALPDIRHPIMGRERPFKGSENVSAYYIIGESEDEEIRNYLARNLAERLPELGFEKIRDAQLKIGRDNQRYFSFGFNPSDNKIIGGQYSCLFLSGYILGLNSKMKADIGKSCRLYLETTKNS